MAKTRRTKLLITLHHRFELWNAPEWLPERLRRDFPGIEIVSRSDYGNLERDIPDAEVFFGWSLRPEQLQAARKLRWIHSPAAAVHQLMFPELVASDVVVTNSREVHAPIVAEHAIALVMALAKRLPSAIHHQQEHVWAQEAMWEERPRPREVAGATLGLIGLGSIGREVAQRALALGMCVLGSRRDPQKGAIPGVTLALLDEVVARADFLLLAAPLTESTRGLINVARLAAMRRDSFLINVSRGPLVDEAALCEALRKRQIAGAALDVFAAEPLASNSPLWDLPNLLITPHTAAVTDRLWERHYELISANLRRYLAGEPLLGVVDKRSGY